jgi:hypothetical protein
MLNAPLRIMIVTALCVLGLIGLVVREGYERGRPATPTSGDIQLQMQAVDPRALLSGHYVIVSLETTLRRPAAETPCSHFIAVADAESWVALANLVPDPRVPDPNAGPPRYSPVGVAATREAAQAIANDFHEGGFAVRGTAYCSELPDEQAGLGPISAASVQTQLVGVQRFYAPQAEAERIDALLRAQTPDDPAQVFAIVNIGRDGRARLKALNVNGEIIELNWL